MAASSHRITFNRDHKMSSPKTKPRKNPVPRDAYNLFTQGKISFEQMTGDAPMGEPVKTNVNPVDRKKARRDEDDIQKKAIAYLQEKYPAVPIYGNATANIFNSGGLYRKALPPPVYRTLAAMGIAVKTWGPLLDLGLEKLGLKLQVNRLEADQEGAKFAQMKRTKGLGAVASWPDIQVCTARVAHVIDLDGNTKEIVFNGLFIELKKPDASSLPFGKHDNGAFTTNDHLQEQAKTLCRLTSQGYLAVFAIGYDGFLAVDEAYFRSPSNRVYLQEQRVTFKDGSTGIFYRIRYS